MVDTVSTFSDITKTFAELYRKTAAPFMPFICFTPMYRSDKVEFFSKIYHSQAQDVFLTTCALSVNSKIVESLLKEATVSSVPPDGGNYSKIYRFISPHRYHQEFLNGPADLWTVKVLMHPHLERGDLYVCLREEEEFISVTLETVDSFKFENHRKSLCMIKFNFSPVDCYFVA